MSQGWDSLRATDTIYMFPFNETIQPVCCPCVTCATVPCCTSRWSAMDLLLWANLFPHEDDVTWSSAGSLRGTCPTSTQTSNWLSETQISSLEFSPSCHHVAWWWYKAWYLDTRGFIPKKIQWHIHTGPWSLVNCLVRSVYEALYKVLMNINEAAVGFMEWPRPWWWSVYPRDTPTKSTTLSAHGK